MPQGIKLQSADGTHHQADKPTSSDAECASAPKRGRRARRRIDHVSRHFSGAVTTRDGNVQPKEKSPAETYLDAVGKLDGLGRKRRAMTGGKHRQVSENVDEGADGASTRPTPAKRAKGRDVATAATVITAQDVTEQRRERTDSQLQKLLATIGLEELSSDSTLTHVPEDLLNPFEPDASLPSSQGRPKPTNVVAVKTNKSAHKSRRRPLAMTKSPYFPHPHKHRPNFLSTLPFPPLDQDRFGLMQERLSRAPFRLLVATIFLNKTPGSRAMPIFYKLMEQYPTPADLARAEQADITDVIRQLGFQNQRARKIIALAKKWVECPPVKGTRFRKLGYPAKGDGKDVKEGEAIDDADPRVAFEISHLPGLGEYSHDSWRMFCRDVLREQASGYNGQDAVAGQDRVFEPEWKRVIPKDKELRAWTTWMWMKEGFVYNKESGERAKASEELMALARADDNVVLESEASTLQVRSLRDDRWSQALQSSSTARIQVQTPAGEHLTSPTR